MERSDLQVRTGVAALPTATPSQPGNPPSPPPVIAHVRRNRRDPLLISGVVERLRQRRRNRNNDEEEDKIEAERVEREVSRRDEEQRQPEPETPERAEEEIPLLNPDQVREFERQARGDYLGPKVDAAHRTGRKYREGQAMTADDLLETLGLVQNRVQRSIAQSTESGYVNTLARFHRFCRIYLPNERMTFELRVMIWCEHQIASGEIEIQSAYQYCKNISAGIQKMGGKVTGMETYMQGLRKSGALAPNDQAQPISKEQMYRLLEFLERDGTDHERAHLLLMWFTASRYDDIEKLISKKVVKERTLEDGRIQWNVRFDVHKGDPFYLGGSSKMVLPPDLSRFLEHFLGRRGPEESATAATYEQVNAAVQSLYPNLSSHSIKRGALMELLQSGVPLETLQVIAKHRSLKTLLIYLDSARVADAIGLPQAAVNL